jgi:hypothetical protein
MLASGTFPEKLSGIVDSCGVIREPSLGRPAKVRGKRLKYPEGAMDDKGSILKKAEDKIRDAAKAVEDFADKVAAPEEPLVILPNDDAPPAKPAAPGKG